MNRNVAFACALLLVGSSEKMALAEDAAPAASEPVVTVDVTSTHSGTVLEKLQTSQDGYRLDVPFLRYDIGTWTTACIAPCRVPLPLLGIYRVKAFNQVNESSPFSVTSGVTKIDVTAGSLALSRAGRLMVVIGGVAAISGLTTALAATDNTTRDASLVVAASSVVPLIIGVVMWAVSGTAVTLR